MTYPPKGSRIEFFDLAGNVQHVLQAENIHEAYRAAEKNPPVGVTAENFPETISVNFYCANCVLGKIILQGTDTRPLRTSMHRLGYQRLGKLK